MMRASVSLAIALLAAVTSHAQNQACSAWGSPQQPLPRQQHAMAFDKARGRLVLFGGTDFRPYGPPPTHMGDTWEYRDNVWTLRSLGGPSPRAGHAMVYDEARGVTVLVGGEGETLATNCETWEWNGSNWTLRSRDGPSSRSGHAMVYDSSRHVTVLFGGWSNNTYSGETWEWDGSTWILLAEDGPARYQHAMAYDRVRQRVVLFGGQATPYLYNGETWEWDGSSWALRSSTGPMPRLGHAMVYDENRGMTVLAGGNSGNEAGTIRLWDTWTWDGRLWTQGLDNGINLTHHAMVYDSLNGRCVMFAGEDGDEKYGENYNQVFAFTATGGDQIPLRGPGFRSSPGMCYDSTRKVTFLFGGSNAGVAIGDSWSWDGATWNLESQSGPSARTGFGMCFDSWRGCVVLFGGNPAQGESSNETWEFSNGQWSLRSTGGPNPRYGLALAFDKARGVSVLFGGYTAHGPNAETWEWDGYTWDRVDYPGPGPRYLHTMAFDESREVTVLSGGNVELGSSDTWEWNGHVWRAVSDDGPHIGMGQMAYEARLRRCVLTGKPADPPENASWAWDGHIWSPLAGIAPSGRENHAIAYDEAREALVVYGGVGGVFFYQYPKSEVWEFSHQLSIFQQPHDATAVRGRNAEFSIRAQATGTVQHQWRKDGLVLRDGAHYSGTTTDTLTIHSIRDSDAGGYQARIQDACSQPLEGDVVSLTVQVPCPADLNGDGAVDFSDLAILTSNYSSTSAGPQDGDLDGDRDVDLLDLSALLVAYGTPCP